MKSHAMRVVKAIFAMIAFVSARADGPVERHVTPPRAQGVGLGDRSTGPLPQLPESHTFMQGQADYRTCVNNVTGATAIALTCFGVAATHSPGGGVAGLLIGASVGRTVFAPLVCTPP